MRALRAAATAVVMMALAAGARAAVHHEPRPLALPLATPAAAGRAATPVAVGGAAEGGGGGELSAGLTAAALAPLGSDAPGTDSAIAGRPAGATRLLDTTVDAHGSRLRIYTSSAAQSELEPALGRAIAGQGFARTKGVDPATVSFTRHHDHVVLRFARRDDRTIVSIVELGFQVAGEAP
jgi:hypothetical protein